MKKKHESSFVAPRLPPPLRALPQRSLWSSPSFVCGTPGSTHATPACGVFCAHRSAPCGALAHSPAPRLPSPPPRAAPAESVILPVLPLRRPRVHSCHPRVWCFLCAPQCTVWGSGPFPRAAPSLPPSARCPSGVCDPPRPSFAAPQGPLMPPPRVVFFVRAAVHRVGRWPIPPRRAFPPPPPRAALAPPLAITRQPHGTLHHHTHRPGLWTGSRAPQYSRRVCGSSIDARSIPPPPLAPPHSPHRPARHTHRPPWSPAPLYVACTAQQRHTTRQV